jgi:hypothetical protein
VGKGRKKQKPIDFFKKYVYNWVDWIEKATEKEVKKR